MVSGSGRKVFQPGEVLTASNVQNYLQDQAVMVYAGTAARGSALGAGTVSDGMMSYLQDTNTVEVYKTSGTAISGWEPVNLTQSPNVIINGDFSINQRGLTSSGISGGYGFDRWYFAANTGTANYSAQTFTPGTAPVAGYEAKNYARLTVSGQSASNAYAQIFQPIEDVRTFAGQTVTVSFWAKAASGTPSIAVEFIQKFGTGGSPSGEVQNYAGKISMSSTPTNWTRYSLTFSMPSISGKTIGTDANSSSLQLNLWVSAGSDFNSRTGSLGIQNNTFDIWGVQVEAGQTATPFRRNANSIQGELAACQRYYYRKVAGAAYGILAAGRSSGTTTINAVVEFPVTMRTIPSSTLDWVGATSYYKCEQGNTALTITGDLSLDMNVTSASAAFVSIPVSGATNGYYTILIGNNTGTAYLGFSAEL